MTNADALRVIFERENGEAISYAWSEASIRDEITGLILEQADFAALIEAYHAMGIEPEFKITVGRPEIA